MIRYIVVSVVNRSRSPRNRPFPAGSPSDSIPPTCPSVSHCCVRTTRCGKDLRRGEVVVDDGWREVVLAKLTPLFREARLNQQAASRGRPEA